jgi:hypothetical protein
MCFSATASFTAAAVLMPAGAFCLKASHEVDRRYWAFAMLPFLFGLQQALEGGLWLALEHGDATAAHGLALGFLLFSHGFWLVWVGFSAYLVETVPWRRRLFRAIAVFGLLFGALMYVPLLIHPDWMQAVIVRHSIQYELRFVTEGFVPDRLLAVVYGGVILLPLLLASDRYHKILGVMVLVSGLVTLALYDWAFMSVWCYFAAILSLYIFVVIAHHVQSSARAAVR